MQTYPFISFTMTSQLRRSEIPEEGATGGYAPRTDGYSPHFCRSLYLNSQKNTFTSIVANTFSEHVHSGSQYSYDII